MREICYGHMLVDTMLRFSIILTFSLLLASCSKDTSTPYASEATVSGRPSPTTSYNFDAVNAVDQSKAETTPKHEYPGKDIQAVFPPETKNTASWVNDTYERSRSFDISGYTITTRNFKPIYLKKNGRVRLKFQTKSSWSDYSAFFAADASLLGPNTKQIYVLSPNTAAVCCTNYWIIDITTNQPRVIFRSEDYGRFREGMEIFDADRDGIYELVQFDATFRYFAGDCGSCSPLPRAYFKYDPTKRSYLPAESVVQDFVVAGIKRSEKWLAEKKDEYDTLKKAEVDSLVQRNALARTADLLFIGEEKRAWKIFDTYVFDPKGDLRKEMKWDLRQSKFYQALRKISSRPVRKR